MASIYQRSSRGRSRPGIATKAEMNLTSMMDLIFILLITFIITFPLIEQGVPVKLPKAKAKAIDSKAKSQAVSIDEKGRFFLNEAVVTPEELEDGLRKAYEADPEMSVLVRGDEKANYREIMAAIKIIHKLGITKLALVTSQE